MRLVVLAALLVPALAAAQVPAKLGYQGRLLKADGSPETGVVQMTFNLFSASSGGSSLWTETQSLALADGYYATLVGEVTAIPATTFDGSELFLEVTVAGNPLTPRHKIASVPYALRAREAFGVKGGAVDATSLTVGGKQVVDSSGKVDFAQMKACGNGEILKYDGAAWACAADAGGMASVAVKQPLAGDGTASSPLALASCNSGEVLKWNGSAWACALDAGGMTSISVSKPLTGDGSSGSPITLAEASATADGYLKKTDFAAFNAKLSTVAVGAGLSGNGTAGAPVAVNFSGTGKAVFAARSDHDHGTPPAAANLMSDTQTFSNIPNGLTNVTSDAAWGVWAYFKYDASKAEVYVENPPADLNAIVGNNWWARNFKVLHVKFSPGGQAAGRILQNLIPSDKPGPVTTSAYIKVLSGKIYLGQENAWMGFDKTAAGTWKRVSYTNDAPTRTLGGAFGFAGEGTVFTEAYIALPKVELGADNTPWTVAAQDGLMNATQLINSQAGPMPINAGTFYTATGNVLLMASGTGYHGGGGVQIGMEILVDGAVRGTAKSYTNEGGSHKAFSPAFLVIRGLLPGGHTVQLRSWNSTASDTNDFYNVTVHDLPY